MGMRDRFEVDQWDSAAPLRAMVEVALFTSRRLGGRPLSVVAVPVSLGTMPDHEREQAARHSAAALAGMTNYSDRNRDQSCLATLSLAIDLLSQETPGAPVAIAIAVEFIAERDREIRNW